MARTAPIPFVFRPWLALLVATLGASCVEATSQDDSCSEDIGCGAAEACVEGRCDSRGLEGDPCRSDGTCSRDSNVTVDGRPAPLSCDSKTQRCEALGLEGASCLSDGTCFKGLTCNADERCEEPDEREFGESCTDSQQCIDGYCNPSGKCGLPGRGEACDAALEQPCAGIDPCVDNLCFPIFSLARGQACELDEQCETRFCRAGICDLAAEGEACGACEEKLACSDGVCRRAAGELCTTAADCHKQLLCEPALDRKLRCVYTESLRCNSLPFDGDFYNVCTEDCLTQCKACRWELQVGEQVAACVAECEPGDVDCYD